MISELGTMSAMVCLSREDLHYRPSYIWIETKQDGRLVWSVRQDADRFVSERSSMKHLIEAGFFPGVLET